jgi:hypothetical protein
LKFEGHHLSINVTLEGESFRGTPLFLGANPAEVRQGPRAGLRVLGAHEDLARRLLASFSDDQRARALDAEGAFRNTINPGRLADVTAPEGLRAAEMSSIQRAMLLEVVARYANTLRPSFAHEELARIEAAGQEQLHFLWQGSTTPDERHYYRIQGPTILIEYDVIADTPDGPANHVHALWRDPERDFGDDLLREHLEAAHPEER